MQRVPRGVLVSKLSATSACMLFSLALAAAASGASFQGLGTIAGTWDRFASTAAGVSGDGQVVVGQGTGIYDGVSQAFVSHSAGKEAVRWVGAMAESLGDLPGGAVNARALDASADGSVIVGYGEDANGLRAFIWDATHGMRPLQDVLEDELGLDLTGCSLDQATGISDDGLTVVGSGPSPFDGGATRGFIAKLDVMPVPLFGGSTLIVLCSALALGGGWGARGRTRRQPTDPVRPSRFLSFRL